jgi:hypothetical protein
MFEEVPRQRRGLAGLPARRIVLGPFVIGGGVLLAALGGSVAVAATVITASTIAINDVPSRQPAAAQQASLSQHPASPGPPAKSARTAAHAPARSTGAAEPPRWRHPVILLPSALSSGSIASEPASAVAPPVTLVPVVPPQAGSPSPHRSGPAGNALIYLIGYDQATGRLIFQFAGVQRGAGPGGSDLYSVSSPDRFTAGIGAGITITSGGQLCPPAGSSCSVGQLIAGAARGVFANAAIDAAANLASVIEVDNQNSSAQPNPSPTRSTGAPALSAAPQPSATPAG